MTIDFAGLKCYFLSFALVNCVTYKIYLLITMANSHNNINYKYQNNIFILVLEDIYKLMLDDFNTIMIIFLNIIYIF